MEKELKISDILREKAINTALLMVSEENQRDISGTPFLVSRGACEDDGILRVGEIEVEGKILFVCQRM